MPSTTRATSSIPLRADRRRRSRARMIRSGRCDQQVAQTRPRPRPTSVDGPVRGRGTGGRQCGQPHEQAPPPPRTTPRPPAARRDTPSERQQREPAASGPRASAPFVPRPSAELAAAEVGGRRTSAGKAARDAGRKTWPTTARTATSANSSGSAGRVSAIDQQHRACDQLAGDHHARAVEPVADRPGERAPAADGDQVADAAAARPPRAPARWSAGHVQHQRDRGSASRRRRSPPARR